MNQHSRKKAEALPFLVLGMVGYFFVVFAPFLVAIALDERLVAGGVANLVISMAGMTSFSIVAMQFVLAAKIRWLENSFGSNSISTLHRTMAWVAALLVLIHVAFLIASRGNLGLVLSPRASWAVFFGRLSAIALLLVIPFSIYRKRIPITNADWRWFHGAFAWTILVSGFAHGISIGLSFESLGVQFVWLGYFATAILAWIIHYRHN